VSQIKLALDRVALLCGTFKMHQSASYCLNPKTLILIWHTGASAGLMPFCSDFVDFVECEIVVCELQNVYFVRMNDIFQDAHQYICK
jgi:hypothetical protein